MNQGKHPLKQFIFKAGEGFDGKAAGSGFDEGAEIFGSAMVHGKGVGEGGWEGCKWWDDRVSRAAGQSTERQKN